MVYFKNNHCEKCKSRTKLLVKKENGFGWWCSVAKDCPNSKPMEVNNE